MTAWDVRCWGVDVPTHEADAVARFLAARPTSRWILLGPHAAQSIRQLQTAWSQAVRQEVRGSMVARSIDAEFLRYLAGTHHIAEAFRRTGLQPDDRHAWIVHLASASGLTEGNSQPVSHQDTATEAECSGLVDGLGWLRKERGMSFSIEGMKRLGIDGEGWAVGREEEACIAHVLMADDQSSSHR